MTLIVIFIALILLYSMVSRRLERTNLTAPIVFTGAGMLALLVLPSLREQQGNLEVFMKVAEIGLVLLLFNDASRIDRQVLKSMRNLPVRLLSVGMLLTILLGASERWSSFANSLFWKQAFWPPSSPRRMPGWDKSS